jgi:hypothetical protein
MSSAQIVQTKFANALIPEVTAKRNPLPFLEDTPEAVLREFKKRQDGFWVGGKTELTKTHVAFKPNVVNKHFHEGDASFAIPLASVNGVAVEGGFLTKVIAISTPQRVYRIRCWGAAKFRDAIARQAGVT